VPEPVIVAAAAPDAIQRAAEALRGGAIVGLPTETVYGVAVRPEPGPLDRLIAAKGRAPDKGIAVLIDDAAQVEELVELPDAARRLAERFWPGALTLVLGLRPDVELPAALTGGGRRLGVRLPDHPVPRALARELGPIAVTSANRSGERDALEAEGLRRQLGGSIALIIDGGPVPGSGTPSTVVSVAEDGSLTILRVGALDERTLTAVADGSGS
jgi:L-threonylcarbamoyladenylate synthase